MTEVWNAAFVYNNLSDAGLITATSHAILLPPSRLQNEHVRKVWRSTSALNQAITFDLGSAQSFDTVYLINTNLTSAGVTRLRASLSDATAQDGAIYGGASLAGQVDPSYGYLPFLLDTPITARYGRIDLSDAALAAVTDTDFIEGGRLVVGLRTQVGINFVPGASRRRGTTSRKVKGPLGGTFIDRGLKYRIWTVEFQMIRESEANGFFEAMEIANGDDVDVLFIRDPSSANLGLDSVWGLITELAPITEPTNSTDIWSKPFQIEERG